MIEAATIAATTPAINPVGMVGPEGFGVVVVVTDLLVAGDVVVIDLVGVVVDLVMVLLVVNDVVIDLVPVTA